MCTRYHQKGDTDVCRLHSLLKLDWFTSCRGFGVWRRKRNDFPFFYGQASENDFSNQLFVLELLPCGSLNGRQRGGIASLASYCNWYTKVIASVFFPTLGNHRFVEILPHNSTVGEACGSFQFHRVLPAWKFPMHERETPSESFRFKWLFKVKNVRFLKFRG